MMGSRKAVPSFLIAPPGPSRGGIFRGVNMTKCYVTRPRSLWVDELESEVSEPPHLVVYEDGNEPQPTGLLDANGNELFRVVDREPIGFRPAGRVSDT